MRSQPCWQIARMDTILEGVYKHIRNTESNQRHLEWESCLEIIQLNVDTLSVRVFQNQFIAALALQAWKAISFLLLPKDLPTLLWISFMQTEPDEEASRYQDTWQQVLKEHVSTVECEGREEIWTTCTALSLPLFIKVPFGHQYVLGEVDTVLRLL